MVGMPLVMASSKGMPKSLDARRIGKTACQLIEGWQVFVRYLMMEVEKMLNALLLEVGLYLVYIRGSSAYSHHMDFGYIALFLIGFCHLVDFCHSLCHQHQVLALLDASYVEHILVGQLVFLLYAALVHHVYLFLWGVIVVHDFLLGIFAYGYHAVGALAGTSKLIVVYLSVYPVIILWGVDKDEVVDSN
jgi:hypothetical protein